MANTTMVHIRVDEKLKREACAALDGIGLSLSDAVRLLLVRVAAEKALPFEIRVPNTNTIRAMEDVKVGLPGILRVCHVTHGQHRCRNN